MSTFKHPINDSLNKINQRLDQLLKFQKQKQNENPEYIIFDNADVMQLFKISSKTASNWREEGILPYVQIKGKLYYKLSDIHAVIDQNYSVKKK
ncbi:Helix-turn-helix domain-containing protein [Bizionia echini]|uniref:Helix-turn-helix domain-containing protein n=1 Tax=Bizionia echini TaxID=649333 RepID=A0A1I4YKB5_9FLAO|nr:helix-turn-helix domain-containing protein [Bizionia echini]SFN38462.1 Helix-turn-helix domain-containing protein [Bizionia echini]